MCIYLLFFVFFLFYCYDKVIKNGKTQPNKSKVYVHKKKWTQGHLSIIIFKKNNLKRSLIKYIYVCILSGLAIDRTQKKTDGNRECKISVFLPHSIASLGV